MNDEEREIYSDEVENMLWWNVGKSLMFLREQKVKSTLLIACRGHSLVEMYYDESFLC